MQQAARLQAAIEILDRVIAAARDAGPPADRVIAGELARRRYAGSADRREIRDLVWTAIRMFAQPPPGGREALLGLADCARPELAPLFDGSAHGPPIARADEPRARPSAAVPWLAGRLAVPADERPALLEALSRRAPLDVRINRRAVADPAGLAAGWPGAAVLSLAGVGPLPLGWRLADAAGGRSVATDGRVEVQDAGSQAVAQVMAPREGEWLVDLCAGAGGKTLALAHHPGAGRGVRLVAADTDRGRLARLPPRARASGVAHEVTCRLLNPGREGERLGDLAGKVDAVLVDAPCSGSGTWRRQPELRWRLTPARLARLVAEQARLLALGAGLVRPGGRLVYAVCSVLTDEGPRQADGFVAASGWQEMARHLLLPHIHECDGFFIARFERPC